MSFSLTRLLVHLLGQCLVHGVCLMDPDGRKEYGGKGRKRRMGVDIVKFVDEWCEVRRLRSQGPYFS